MYDCAVSTQEEALPSQLPAASPSMWQVKVLAANMSFLVKLQPIRAACCKGGWILCWRSNRACWALSAHMQQLLRHHKACLLLQ